jgi:hypothetical protein
LAGIAAAFLALFLVAEVTVRLASDQLLPRAGQAAEEVPYKNDQLIQLAAAGHDPEVVFFGSSTIDAGIDPAVVDTSSSTVSASYNAALQGYTLDVPQRWVDEFVLARVEPQLAVIGVTPIEVVGAPRGQDEGPLWAAAFTTQFDELSGGPAASVTRTANDLSSLVRLRNRIREPWGFATAVWATVRQEAPRGVVARPPDFWDHALTDAGAILAYREGALRTAPTTMVRRITALLRSPLRLDRLDEVHRRIGAVEGVLLIPPIALRALGDRGLPVERYQEIAEQITERGAELGMPTLDFSGADYPDALFFDSMHLNAAGTQRLSAEVAAALDALCHDRTHSFCEAP